MEAPTHDHCAKAQRPPARRAGGLFVAMSALCGRPMHEAFDALAELEADGLQLTPGNLPQPGFEQHVARSSLPWTGHHSFDFSRLRRAVYDEFGHAEVLPSDWSIHPPPLSVIGFDAWLEHALERDQLCEAMYPGHHLGGGPELEAAMQGGLRLALDISHLHIQVASGALSPSSLARVLDYDRVSEVHVSHNDGRRDSHRPLCAETPLLAWARAKLTEGIPVIYEGYLHRLDHDARRRQIEFIRGGT